MAAEVAEGAVAEVVPAAPLAWVVDGGFVGSGGCGAEPAIPVEAGGDGVRAVGASGAAGPAVGWVPDVDFGDGAEEVCGDEFHGAAEIGGGTALVAGLGDDLGVAGEFAELAGFGEGMGEGFFAVDVFACGDGGFADGCVPVVRGGDDDGVDVWGGEELVEIGEGGGIGGGVAFAGVFDLGGVDVAEGGGFVAEFEDAGDVALDLAAHADEADAEFSGGRGLGEDWRSGEGGGGCGFEERAAGEERGHGGSWGEGRWRGNVRVGAAFRRKRGWWGGCGAKGGEGVARLSGEPCIRFSTAAAFYRRPYRGWAGLR